MKSMPARYSPIAPIALLEDLQEKMLLGNYLLLLGHDMLQNMDRYKTLIENIRTEDRNHPPFIILDNSTIERGHPLTPEEMRPIIEGLDIDCYCLPDAMGDRNLTIEWAREHKDIAMDLNVPIMHIPQGATMEEWCGCAVELYGDENIPHIPHLNFGDLFAVPRWLTNKFGSRKPAIQFLNKMLVNAIAGTHSIHLLGMSENFRDDIASTALPYVRGIDSANPLSLGQTGQIITGMSSAPHIDRGSLWDNVMVTTSTHQNITAVRDFMMVADYNSTGEH